METIIDGCAQDVPPIKDEGYTYTPCTSMEWALLPKPTIPPKVEFEPVEKFVTDAIKSISSRSTPTSAEEYKSSVHAYKSILEAFRKGDDLVLLKNILLALRTGGNGTTLNDITSETKKHSNLLHLIFRFDSFNVNANVEENSSGAYTKTADFTLVDAHLNLLVALVSANSVLLSPTLNTMWRNIESNDAITPIDRQLALKKPSHDLSVSEIKEIINNQFQRNARLHGTLMKILQLVPKGNSEIFSVIASSFPFKLSPLEKQVAYVKQAFTVLNYVPTMHQDLICLCIDKCLEIDVEIRIAQDGAVNIEEADEDDQFDLEKDSQKADVNQEVVNNEQTETFKTREDSDQVSEMAEKLDTLMYLTFDQLHSSVKNGFKTPTQLFKMVIAAFDSVILTTHRSKFTQFLILYLCGLDSDKPKEDLLDQSMLSREFAAKLIELVLDPYRPTITRQSAACYLASFVSRSKFVCPGTACEAVSAILRFADAYMDTYPTEAVTRKLLRNISTDIAGNGKTSKLAVHSLFFTVCQTGFYIMCFRGKECTKYYHDAIAYFKNVHKNALDDDIIHPYSDPELIDISLTRWTRLCSHHLNPLKYCLESVRGEFLLLADRFKLIEDDLLSKLIIEDRKMATGSPDVLKASLKKATSIKTAATMERRRLVEGVGGLGRGSNPLDSFFPFDPYLLRRSHKFIHPYYRHWSGASTQDESDNDEDYEESAVGTMDDESVTSEEDSNDSSEESVEQNDHLLYEDECIPMSLTSTATSSMVSIRKGNENVDEYDDYEDYDPDEIDDKVTAEDMKIPRETWVHELKRARALSVEDCW